MEWFHTLLTIGLIVASLKLSKVYDEALESNKWREIAFRYVQRY